MQKTNKTQTPMNRDIYDMRFDGSEEDLILQDFITRAEPANAVNERLMARIYEKIQADKAQKRRRWWRVAGCRCCAFGGV